MDLAGTPYSFEGTGRGVLEDVEKLNERVQYLRASGVLTQATLRSYFGDKRFEQIAESNALEGSTLNVGETQLAVLRGVTVAGHDPGYSRDAIQLADALARITELATLKEPTDLEQVKEVHGLILGDRPGAGMFRTEAVTIRGSAHRPPRTWAEVMDGMEAWANWSQVNADLPSLLRGIVLHTWLTHIHPFIDGNGRTSRALLNLELIRGGLPSVIIRRKDRERYLDALAESDEGGDLGPISELVIDRAKDALRDLERAAQREQGYDEAAERMRTRQARHLAIWNDAVKLLFSLVEEATEHVFGQVGDVRVRWYDDNLPLDDFVALSQGDPAGNSWLFKVEADVPAVGSASYLAWTGYRSDEMRSLEDLRPGPAIFWSIPDPTGYRPWIGAEGRSPGGRELTLDLPNVDRWIVRRNDGTADRLTPSALVQRIVRGIEASLAGDPT